MGYNLDAKLKEFKEDEENEEFCLLEASKPCPPYPLWTPLTLRR